MRWTAPMNAPSPPPTMPMRSLRFHDSTTAVSLPARSASEGSPSLACASGWYSPSTQAEDLAVGGRVTLAAGEVVEGHLGRLDDVPGEEGRAFLRPLRGALDAALPFHDGPAVIARLGQEREYPLEVDLPVA